MQIRNLPHLRPNPQIVFALAQLILSGTHSCDDAAAL